MKIKTLTILAFLICTLARLSSFSLAKGPERMGPIQKSDDVERISNPKAPRNPSLKIVFKEELSIGVKEGDENYMFGKRVYFNTDEDGNFYVTDWDRKRIQKYDPLGKYILTIGREGQGPGEFQNVWRAEFDKDKNLYVIDIASYRISFFDQGGKYLRDLRFPATNVSSTLYLNTKGFFITVLSELTEDQEGSSWKNIFGLFDEKFNPIAEMYKATRELKSAPGRSEDSVAQTLANIIGDMAFKPFMSYALAEDDSVYFGFPEKYEICVYSPEGKLTKIIQREYEPIKISDKDKEAFIKIQEDEFFRFLPSPAQAMKDKVTRLIKYPQYKPAYQTFALMENGWLAVIVDSGPGEYALFDLFDREGRYIGQFKANIPTDGLFFKNGKAYAVETTEDGYKFVKRYEFNIE